MYMLTDKLQGYTAIVDEVLQTLTKFALTLTDTVFMGVPSLGAMI
jgi:hypothetical protein